MRLKSFDWIWLFFEKFFRLGVSVVSGVIVARAIGPENFGQISYAITTGYFILTLSTLGLDQIIFTRIIDKKDDISTLYYSAFFMKFAAWVFFSFIGTLLSFSIKNSTQTDFFLLGIFWLAALMQGLEPIEYWYQIKKQTGTPAISKIIGTTLAGVTKVTIALTTHNIFYIALAHLIESIFIAILACKTLKQLQSGKLKIRIKWTIIKSLITESWQLWLSAIGIAIYTKFDLIILEQLLGKESLGKYAAALPFSQSIALLSVISATAITPKLRLLYTQNRPKYEIKIRQAISTFFYASLLISTLIYVFSSIIVTKILGQQYIESSKILAIHCFSNSFIALGLIQTIHIINTKKSSQAIIQTCLGATTNIIANYILIPRLGISGAAFAAIFAQFSSVIVSNILFNRELFKTQIQGLFFVWHPEEKQNGKNDV